MSRVVIHMIRDPATAFGLLLLAAVALLAVFAGQIAPGDPFEIVGRPYQPPFGIYLLGTDTLGRSLATGLVHGARASLLIGLAAAFIITLIGVTVGAIGGYVGGRTDAVFMRLTETFQTIPSFLFAIVLVAVLQPALSTMILVIGLVSWPPLARLVRAEVAALRRREFVQGCTALGMRNSEILLLQVLPNALPVIVVSTSTLVATAILFESGLSFLGLGDPNVMSWGLMIGVGRAAIRTAWWMSAIPGLAILLTVLAINLVGDGLNDALDPRRMQR